MLSFDSTTMDGTLNIKKCDIELPNQQDAKKLAFLLFNVFTPEECKEWIEVTEQRQYSPALLNLGSQQVLMTDVRDSDRCIIDDTHMAQKLYERIKSFLPNELYNCKLVGLNERLRFLRYDKGQKFEPHYGK